MEEYEIGKRLHDILRLFHSRVNERLEKKGYSKTEFLIISYLKRNQDKDVTQKDLVEFSKMKAPTVSITLSNLEAEGIVLRKKSTKDSRKTIVELSEKGMSADDEIRSAFAEVNQLMLNEFNDEEIALFSSFLSRMSNALEVGDV